MPYKTCDFDRDWWIMKGILCEEQGAFLAISRLPFEGFFLKLHI